MDPLYTNVVSGLKSSLQSSPNQRILVAVAGPPGSGKSTIAHELVDLINEPGEENNCSNTTSSPIFAVSIPVDGFHYTRSYLDTLPNREEAYRRRGAPWTFDVEGIIKLIKKLKLSAETSEKSRETILAPSFDHALKDPVEDDIEISSAANIIILEGNYLLLNMDRWKEISQLVDVTIFIDVDAEAARKRVAQRHIEAGIEDTMAKALKRFDDNDGLNGDLIRQNLVPFDFKITSIDWSDMDAMGFRRQA